MVEGEYAMMGTKAMMDAFLKMNKMVEVLYNRDQEEGALSTKAPKEVKLSVRAKGVGGGGDPLESPSPSSYYSSESEHSSYKKKSSKKYSHSHDLPLLKLDAKFDLPVFDGELDVEKLDN